MKLVHSAWGLHIKLPENEVPVLVVENPQAMAKILQELYCQFHGEEGGFVLSECNNILKLNTSASLILEPFSINCNEKKILSRLYMELTAAANDDFYEMTSHIGTEIINYIDVLIASVPYPIDFNCDFNILPLLKAQAVKLEETAGTLVERIINYIKVSADLTETKLLIFLNLKSFVNKEELVEIYKSSFYNKINLLLIESTEGCKIENEQVYIIDTDLCVITIQ